MLQFTTGRRWTAHKNWHETYQCGYLCDPCNRGTVNDPCSNYTPGNFGDCSIDTVGGAGHQGAKGDDGVEGPAGYPGMDSETAETGEEGSRGQDAATYVS